MSRWSKQNDPLLSHLPLVVGKTMKSMKQITQTQQNRTLTVLFSQVQALQLSHILLCNKMLFGSISWIQIPLGLIRRFLERSNTARLCINLFPPPSVCALDEGGPIYTAQEAVPSNKVELEMDENANLNLACLKVETTLQQ